MEREQQSELTLAYQRVFCTESPPAVVLNKKLVDQYQRHGIAVIPLSVPSMGTLLIDTIRFPEAKQAWLKGFSKDGFRLVISSGKQASPKKHRSSDFVELTPNNTHGLLVRVHHGVSRNRQVPYRTSLEVLSNPA